MADAAGTMIRRSPRALLLSVSTCLAALSLGAWAQIARPRIDVVPPNSTHGWLRLNSSWQSNTVLQLWASTNLLAWQNLATLHDALYAYPDLRPRVSSQTFYRLLAAPRLATNDWKNQVLYSAEPFRSTNSPASVRWVKFAILLNDTTRVYYQDCRKFLFHYDFATQRLPPFVGMDYASFNAVSLHRTNQQVVLGAVLFPPLPTVGEFGVQFAGLDPYSPEQVAQWFALVKGTIYATNGAAAFYIPAFEQSEMARTNAAAFASLGVPLDGMERWVSVNPCYSPGWALGRLKYFAANEVAAEWADGRLRPEDILLTDGVPADSPLVAGILSLSPSTPNSHTAILSQSFGVPFAWLAEAAEQSRVLALVGHKVLLRATVNALGAQIKVVDVEGVLDPALEAELLALKLPAPINYRPKQVFGDFWAPVDNLVPSDIQFFGGKASNFGFLRRSIPTNCPVAIAFSFDLWDAFLDQIVPGGRTLRAEVALRLAAYTNYPPDIVSLKTNLAVIRDLFTRVAGFNGEQQQAITNALLPVFNAQRKIRFRSSTNVEDTESFTGAGLYDSYSGCLMDDLDADTAGPSHCDPADTSERGVFRALQKVYASFYNDDAFLERLMHRVNESEVGMGVLVHHSFPDEDELANGVATPAFSFTSFSTNASGQMVSQLGAESVTNPDGTSIPEIVQVSRYNSSYDLVLQQTSSRVPLGQYVMSWQQDYLGFMDLFSRVAYAFRSFYPARTRFNLDLEYKKDVNLGLVVKQVRELPQPPATNQPAWLIDEPSTLSVMQAEGSDVFASHRLKSLWNLHTANMKLIPGNLIQGIYTQGDCEYLEDATIQTLGGTLSSWHNAATAQSGVNALNTWTTGNGNSRRTWRLQTTLTTNVSGSQPPVFTQSDFPRSLTVTYASPVPTFDSHDGPGLTTNETVRLELRPALSSGDGAILKERLLVRTNVLTVQTSFYWPKTPDQIIIYTAPLVQFLQTRITGLTSTPIVLSHYYSQTYAPGHHNFTEEFIFEPRLEPGLPAATLAELNAANVRLLYANWQFTGNVTFYVLGLDGTFSRL